MFVVLILLFVFVVLFGLLWCCFILDDIGWWVFLVGVWWVVWGVGCVVVGVVVLLLLLIVVVVVVLGVIFGLCYCWCCCYLCCSCEG